MIKKIGIAIIGIIAILLGYAATQPAEYVISRSVTVEAPAKKIFPYLNSPKLAEQWAPWSKVDPNAKVIYSGPHHGVGARSSWDGGKQLGTGSATVVESVDNKLVGVKLEYLKPMKMEQYSEYLMESNGSATTVTWRVTGKNNFIGRVMCLFMNMDKMVGGMFEQGLSSLKTLVEATK